MRKITCECENPLDNILIHISDYMCPYAKKLYLTPNILTTISLIFCGISVILLLNKQYLLAAFMYLISYYFRSWNMSNKFSPSFYKLFFFIKNFFFKIPSS